MEPRPERKLVLFTLGILVGMVIVAVSILSMANKAETLATPLVTLAGTGMGFIGGLMRREADEPDNSGRPPADSRVQTATSHNYGGSD